MKLGLEGEIMHAVSQGKELSESEWFAAAAFPGSALLGWSGSCLGPGQVQGMDVSRIANSSWSGRSTPCTDAAV